MQSFPRLTAVFGAPVEALTAQHVLGAVAQKVPEAADLDWKQELYGSRGENKQELAKDVAALANATGGILVLGVAEESSSSAADMVKPVVLSDAETERMQKICQYTIRPFLPGVRIFPLPIDGGDTGFYVIAVPRSPDAPHAILRGNDNGDGTVLSYPMRDGQIIRYLHEPEIARRYRDRFTSRDERAAALDQLHQEGLRRTQFGTAWLSLSLYPSAPGTRHSVGSATIAQIAEDTKQWADTTPRLPEEVLTDGRLHSFPAVRRAVLTLGSAAASVLSKEFAELHFNGAGFVAVPLANASIDLEPAVKQDVLELRLLSMVRLLAHHATMSGAGGDCELQARLQLLVFDSNHRVAKPTSLFAPTTRYRGADAEYSQVAGSILAGEHPTAVNVTASLEELMESARAAVQTTHALATDIISHFAVADTCILRADGGLSTDNVGGWWAGAIDSWASVCL